MQNVSFSKHQSKFIKGRPENSNKSFLENHFFNFLKLSSPFEPELLSLFFFFSEIIDSLLDVETAKDLKTLQSKSREKIYFGLIFSDFGPALSSDFALMKSGKNFSMKRQLIVISVHFLISPHKPRTNPIIKISKFKPTDFKFSTSTKLPRTQAMLNIFLRRTHEGKIEERSC